jgi:hypothetical protein
VFGSIVNVSVGKLLISMLFMVSGCDIFLGLFQKQGMSVPTSVCLSLYLFENSSKENRRALQCLHVPLSLQNNVENCNE